MFSLPLLFIFSLPLGQTFPYIPFRSTSTNVSFLGYSWFHFLQLLHSYFADHKFALLGKIFFWLGNAVCHLLQVLPPTHCVIHFCVLSSTCVSYSACHSIMEIGEKSVNCWSDSTFVLSRFFFLFKESWELQVVCQSSQEGNIKVDNP